MGLPATVGGKVTAADINNIANLPVANFAALPASGNWLGRQIATSDSGLTYRWTGSVWSASTGSQIVPSAATNGSVSGSGVVTSSAQTFVRVLDAFPSGFTVFRVVYDVTLSAAVGLLFRLAVDASDSSTGYDYQRTSEVNVTVVTTQDLNQSSGSLSPIGLATRHVGQVLLFGPNVASETLYDASSLVTPNPMTTSAGRTDVGGQHRPLTAYNSLRVFGSSGTITINRLSVAGVA